MAHEKRFFEVNCDADSEFDIRIDDFNLNTGRNENHENTFFKGEFLARNFVRVRSTPLPMIR